MNLRIDRSKWRTGGYGKYQSGVGATQLLNSEGYMCCLGFYCKALGVPKKDLIEKAIPSSLEDYADIPDLARLSGDGKFLVGTDFTYMAISINDDSVIVSKERERKLKDHFSTIGVKVTFTGKY